jgi:hypothetical protein
MHLRLQPTTKLDNTLTYLECIEISTD